MKNPRGNTFFQYPNDVEVAMMRRSTFIPTLRHAGTSTRYTGLLQTRVLGERRAFDQNFCGMHK